MKMGGRVKNWKRRWFTLSEGKLSYFKSRVSLSNIIIAYATFTMSLAER